VTLKIVAIQRVFADVHRAEEAGLEDCEARYGDSGVEKHMAWRVGGSLSFLGL
jgi:hypothetical protein